MDSLRSCKVVAPGTIQLGPPWSLQGSKGGSLSAEGGPLAAPGIAPSLTLLREFSNAVDRTGAYRLIWLIHA